jgi:excisionase family DNA binding protein
MDSIEKMAYSPIEAAGATGLCLNTIYKLLKQNRLKSVRVNRKLLIPRTSIEAFLAGQSGTAGV